MPRENASKAGILLGMAIESLRSIPKGSILGDGLQFNDCLQSMFILHHLQGSVISSACLAAILDKENSLPKPSGSLPWLVSLENAVSSEKK